MDCPFCGKKMREGRIPSRDRLKWKDDLSVDPWESVPLSSVFGGSPKTFYCPDCRQIILPVPEKAEGVIETMERKLSAVGDKIDAAQKQWEARRDQTKEQKKKKEFGSKDPWER